MKLPNIYLDNQVVDLAAMNQEEVKVEIPAANTSSLLNATTQQLNLDASPAVKAVVPEGNSLLTILVPKVIQKYEADDPMSKWMQVNEERQEEIQHKLNKNYDEDAGPAIKIIGYTDVWMYFLTENYSDVIDDIVRETSSSGGIMSMFKAKGSLDKGLQGDRDIFLCLAKVGLDTSIEEHDRILSSIYMHLTGEKSCNRTGQHWVDVGFQNPDPITDIRGSGILGLIQLLYFVELYNEQACRY